jgi:AI-2 transport protein TqsA
MNEQAEQRIQSTCLLILAGAAVTGLLYFFQSVMIPFVLAMFIAIAMTPVIDVQRRYLRFPQPMAALVTLLLALVVLLAMGGVISISVARLADNSAQYAEQVQSLLDRTLDALPLEKLGVDPRAVEDSLLTVPTETIKKSLLGTANAVLDVLSQGVMVFIFIGFLLFGGGRQTVTREGVSGELIGRTRQYILVLTAISTATGVLVGVTLWLIGVPLAMVFGLLAFLLNFIPSIGSIIATLLPLPVILVTPQIGPVGAVLAIAIPGAVQFVLGNIIQPRVMGRSFDLHPVTVLMALIFWGVLWGIVGMLLATPITAIIKFLLDRSELTRPAGQLLAGRLGSSQQADDHGCSGEEDQDRADVHEHGDERPGGDGGVDADGMEEEGEH